MPLKKEAQDFSGALIFFKKVRYKAKNNLIFVIFKLPAFSPSQKVSWGVPVFEANGVMLAVIIFVPAGQAVWGTAKASADPLKFVIAPDAGIKS